MIGVVGGNYEAELFGLVDVVDNVVGQTRHSVFSNFVSESQEPLLFLHQPYNDI